jgi:hypothetical protein
MSSVQPTVQEVLVRLHAERKKVRDLEARLAESERLALSSKDAWEMYKAAFERAERAEAIVAEWRPVVSLSLEWAAVECGGVAPDARTPARRVFDVLAALSDAAREAAR